MKLSSCGRFVVLGDLHLDQDVARSLGAWAAKRGLPVQAAVQLAVIALVGQAGTDSGRVVPPAALVGG